MNKFIVICLMVCFVSGCASFTSGSLPKVPKQQITLPEAYKKKDVSFSVSYYQQVGDDIIINEKKLRNAVKKSFVDSGLFKKVTYRPFSPDLPNHYHFDLKLTGPSIEQQYAIGMLAGSTLTIFPMWINYYVDITMFHFKEGQEIYSATSSERVTDLFWIPLAITWPFLNHGTMGSMIKNTTMRYFLYQIKEHELRHMEQKPISDETKDENLDIEEQ